MKFAFSEVLIKSELTDLISISIGSNTIIRPNLTKKLSEWSPFNQLAGDQAKPHWLGKEKKFRRMLDLTEKGEIFCSLLQISVSAPTHC